MYRDREPISWGRTKGGKLKAEVGHGRYTILIQEARNGRWGYLLFDADEADSGAIADTHTTFRYENERGAVEAAERFYADNYALLYADAVERAEDESDDGDSDSSEYEADYSWADTPDDAPTTPAAGVPEDTLKAAAGHISEGYYLDERGLLRRIHCPRRRGESERARKVRQKVMTQARAREVAEAVNVAKPLYCESLADAMQNYAYEMALTCNATNEDYPIR